MRKTILIGSIIAVAILIDVSFNSVIGYRSVASDMKASPLFNIRTSKAIDEESEDISCEYVGKGEYAQLSIPKRNGIMLSFQKTKMLIDIISKMDGKTYNKFMGLVINRMKQNGHKDIDNLEIVNTLNQLRINQEVKGFLYTNSDNPQPYSYNKCTFLVENVKPVACFLYWIFSILSTIWIIFVLLMFYLFYETCIMYTSCESI